MGSSGVLVITGRAGHREDRARRRGRDARRRDARCCVPAAPRPSGRCPFGGLLQLLRPALDELDRIPAPQRDALAAALALSEHAAGDRFAVGAATLSLVCRYAEAAPVALLVDDVHLLDRPSAEALLFVARRLLADPIALLATARSRRAAPAGRRAPARAARWTASTWRPRGSCVALPVRAGGSDRSGRRSCTGRSPATRSRCSSWPVTWSASAQLPPGAPDAGARRARGGVRRPGRPARPRGTDARCWWPRPKAVTWASSRRRVRRARGRRRRRWPRRNGPVLVTIAERPGRVPAPAGAVGGVRRAPTRPTAGRRTGRSPARCRT